jgi:hypothetical protein
MLIYIENFLIEIFDLCLQYRIHINIRYMFKSDSCIAQKSKRLVVDT